MKKKKGLTPRVVVRGPEWRTAKIRRGHHSESEAFAWDIYAAVSLAGLMQTRYRRNDVDEDHRTAAEIADEMFLERRKRFGGAP